MRFTLFSNLLLVALYAVSVTASIGFTQVPALMYTGKTYIINWGGGDGTVNILLSSPCRFILITFRLSLSASSLVRAGVRLSLQ